METRKDKFLKKAKIKHKDKYDYSKISYIDSRTKVIIICKIHGEFLQEPASHLRGRGCSKCSGKYNQTTSEFLEEVRGLHKNKYTYDKVDYVSRKTPIIITCLNHGDFSQIPDDHLRGHGCLKCGNESHWRRSDYIEKSKGRPCTYYILECSNEEEIFYKIGMTMSSVKVRYSTNSKMPYKFDVISEVKGEAGEIWDLELQEKRKLKEFNYQPKIEFGGSKTECFTKYKINNNDQ